SLQGEGKGGRGKEGADPRFPVFAGDPVAGGACRTDGAVPARSPSGAGAGQARVRAKGPRRRGRARETRPGDTRARDPISAASYIRSSVSEGLERGQLRS